MFLQPSSQAFHAQLVESGRLRATEELISNFLLSGKARQAHLERASREYSPERKAKVEPISPLVNTFLTINYRSFQLTTICEEKNYIINGKGDGLATPPSLA